MGRFARAFSALQDVGLASGYLDESNDKAVESQLANASERLLVKLHARRLAVLAKVRELPAGCPMSAEAAIRAKRVAEFEALLQLNEEWALLDRAHRLLLEEFLARPSLQLLYADTQREPDEDERGRPSPYGPPVGSLERLLFLSTPAAQFWTPSAGATLAKLGAADRVRGAAGQQMSEPRGL
jgi:hypothetical protein